MLKRLQSARRPRGFGKSENGLAAVEFALILPVMLAMLFGLGELSLAVFARAAVAQVSSTVADLVAQESQPSKADLSNVYMAANSILYPYYPRFSTTAPTIRVTSVIYDTVGKSATVGKVGWTCKQTGSGSLPAMGSTVDLLQKRPSGAPSPPPGAPPLLTSGSSVVLVEVAYAYSSPTTQVIKQQGFDMRDNFFTKPRRVAQIPKPDACP